MNFFSTVLRDKNMTVAQVSRMTGIPQSTLFDFKAGRNTPRAASLNAIAQATGVTVEYLLTGEGETKHYEDPLTAELAERMKDDHDLRLLFMAAKDASPETLSVVYALLKTLKEREKGDTW